MDIKEIYLQSQTHKIISLDKSREMLSHAYMLESSDEFILDKYSLFIAKEIFCLDFNTPCDKCNNCIKVEHNNMVDLKIYPRESKGIVVDDINEIVTDAYIRPIDSQYKVYILKNFDTATIQAQNKLLKTLEEPPTNVIFVITCANSSSVLPTICSRVKIISEGLLNVEIVANYLEGIGVKDFNDVARVSGGNISTAMNIASKGETNKIINLAIDTLIGLKSSSDILKFSSQILALKKDFHFFLDTLISILRDISVSGNSELIIFKSKQNEIISLSKIYNKKALDEISEKLTEIYNKLDFNCNITGIVDSMLLNILEVRYLCQE
ncbi:MAG: ATP-binding protein [Christensenellales bacterium]